MKKLMRIIGLSFFMCWILSTVRAEDFPERRVPDVQTATIKGTEYKCFDTAQYATLLLLSSDYQALRQVYYLNIPKTYNDLEDVYVLKLSLKDDEISFLRGKLSEAQKEIAARYAADEKVVKRLQLSATGWKIISGIEAALLVVMTGYAIFK
jgi:hypothetical protein